MNNEMEQKHIPTDEQIARFLGGTATEEEKNAVLEYMSQSDENLEEVLAIADAVQAQRSSLTSQQSTSKSVAWRIAASVAVILLAGGAWLLLRDRGVNLEATPSNTVAMNTTPVVTPTPGGNATDGQTPSSDNTIVPTNNQATRQSNNALIADADAAAGGDEALSSKYNSMPQVTTRTSIDEGSQRNVAAVQRNDNSSSTQDYLRDVIVVENPRPRETTVWEKGTPFTFSWKCSDAENVILWMKDKDGNKWILREDITGKDGSYVIPAEKQALFSGTIVWKIEVYFRSGHKKSPTGFIRVD